MKVIRIPMSCDPPPIRHSKLMRLFICAGQFDNSKINDMNNH